MRISLILATIDRTQEVDRFLDSLVDQTYSDFEVIVIDQNMDNRLSSIIEYYQQCICIKYLKAQKGLSKARNIGLRMATGDIIAFPDDDCWYDSDVIEMVVDFFCKNNAIDGVTGRSIDEFGNSSAGRFKRESCTINLYNVWQCGVSITVFLRKSVIARVGNFDELLGVGANSPWGSSEETDYLIRAIKGGANLFFNPEFTIRHPNPTAVYDRKTIARAYQYGCGMGYVIKKHKYPLFYIGYILIRPFVGCIIAIISGHLPKANFYWNSFCGRLYGWLFSN